MSQGPRYKSELDGLVSQAVRKLEGAPMTTRDIIENAKALITAAKGSNVIPPPYLIMVPVGTNLLDLANPRTEGAHKTLIDVLLEIEGVKDVKVSPDSPGLSIETIS